MNTPTFFANFELEFSKQTIATKLIENKQKQTPLNFSLCSTEKKANKKVDQTNPNRMEKQAKR